VVVVPLVIPLVQMAQGGLAVEVVVNIQQEAQLLERPTLAVAVAVEGKV
jgi:hypothetical protein